MFYSLTNKTANPLFTYENYLTGGKAGTKPTITVEYLQ